MTDEQKKKLKKFYIDYYKKVTAVSLEEKDYEYALKAAKSGMKMDPMDSFFLESAGWAALNSKQYNDAAFYFKKVLERDPKNYTIMYGLGLAYVNLKDFEKAKKAFKAAEATTDMDLLYKLAEIYRDTNMKKDAYRVVKLIEELNKRSLLGGAKEKKEEGPKIKEELTLPPKKVKPANVDELQTYNPFLDEVSAEQPTEPPPSDIKKAVEDAVKGKKEEKQPKNDPEVDLQPIEVKKKARVGWF
jgi:tetratricopeptide (TPR) repeat protein